MHSISIEEQIIALESACQRAGYNYALFCGPSEDKLLSTTSVTLQQIGIITETLCYDLTPKEMEFISRLISEIEAKKLS